MAVNETGSSLEYADAASTAPEEFINLVRDALAHLYDFAHLECHPLSQCLPPAEVGTGRALRNLLLDTIDRLQPDSSVPASDRAWRPYNILLRRYVDGFEIDAIITDMHISLRQYHRDHRKGLRAVGELVWYHRARGEQDPEILKAGAPMVLPSEEQMLNEVARLGVERRQLDLSGIVTSVVESARRLAQERDIAIITHAPDEPVIVSADLALARQASLSTVSALIGAHPQRLEIGWRSSGDLGIVDIRPSPPLRNDGSATALEMARRLEGILPLIEAQHARLEVSREGDALVGVQLLFPKAEGALVYVVDDDALLLQLFERYLASEGYRFRGYRSADKALAAARRERPSAMILDVMMRGIDGWQLLQTLHADPDLAQVPVIVCSVLDEVDLAMSLGAQGYIKKPASQQQVLTAVRVALEGCSQGVRHREPH